MKDILQNMNSITAVDITRSKSSRVGGYVWTVSFVEDLAGTLRGDLPDLEVISNLNSGAALSPSISVKEVRKGTLKEVQLISISAGSTKVNPLSSFQIEFQGQRTGDILALPIGETSCLGSTAAKQLITSSTEDTSTAGGDNTVSHQTTFTISYGGFVTALIKANDGACANAANMIELELSKLPPLQNVMVNGQPTNNGDDGCEWEVTLLSVTGNPELMTGMYYMLLIFYAQ